jgi:hypothetical protein
VTTLDLKVVENMPADCIRVLVSKYFVYGFGNVIVRFFFEMFMPPFEKGSDRLADIEEVLKV